MKTRVKGNAVQRKLIKRFEEKGFLVAKVEQKGRFVKQKDMFGLFDLVVIRDSCVRFVQVTCNKPHVHKPFLEFSKKYSGVVGYYQYVWYDRKGWVAFNYSNGEKRKYDLRRSK